MQVGQRGLYLEVRGGHPAPCVVTRVHDQIIYPGIVNVVVTLDGASAGDEYADEDKVELVTHRTTVPVLVPGDARVYPCVYDLA